MVDIVNVPSAVGLPDLALAAGALAPTLLLGDDPSVLAALGPVQWGVFDSQSGAPVIICDTCLDLGYTKAFQVSDFVIEENGFISYDSVENPYESRIRVASGGSPDVRAALISSVDSIIGDLNFYSVVTPDKIYVQANLIREEYRRAVQEGGASLLQIDISLQEIRTLPSSTTGQNSADPASANQQNGGTVQAQTPTQTQTSGALPVFASGTVPPPTLQ